MHICIRKSLRMFMTFMWPVMLVGFMTWVRYLTIMRFITLVLSLTIMRFRTLMQFITLRLSAGVHVSRPRCSAHAN